MWFLLAEFPYPVEVTQTERGHPRIHYNGYAYGLYKTSSIYKRERHTWFCTRMSAQTGPLRKRCRAKIRTLLINNSMKIGIEPSNHICAPTDEIPYWMASLFLSHAEFDRILNATNCHSSKMPWGTQLILTCSLQD